MKLDFRDTAPTLASALENPRNNFTLLRLLLALAVVVSHAFSVTTGQVEDEPLARLTGFTLGEHAVNGFFAISGFLVAMSFDRRGWRDYVIARSLRIAPGLIVAALMVALVMGAAFTRLSLAEYYASGELWRFLGLTLATYKSNIALPGVFEGNPFRFPMGTVWTLKYEVLCYAGVLGFGILGLLRSRLAALALVTGLALALSAAAIFHPFMSKGTETALRLPLIFAIGGALYVWREEARLSGWVALILVLATFVLAGTPLYRTTLFVASAYGIIWLAFLPRLAALAREPVHDLSYGVYLYGWPIQQSLHALFPQAGSWTLLGPSLALSLGVALLSWRFVEKPALRIKTLLLERQARPLSPALPG